MVKRELLMKRKVFFTELAYVFGVIFLALGTALMELADFGMSMVVAPAYLLHLKLSQYIPFFSFGMAEYTLQAIIIAILAIFLRRFKRAYLFSFGTALIYGITLDVFMLFVAFWPADVMMLRMVCFFTGMLLCSCGVSLFFHTYISPEAYELFVKEISEHLHINITKFKTMYDCTSCMVAIAFSFSFFGFGQFVGVNLGTVLCAVFNGFLIGRFTQIFESVYEFRDGLRFRKFFEK